MEKPVVIWDLPVRVLHWLLALCLLGAFAVAHLVDDESPAFILHMVLGLTAAFLVVLRLLWGLVGSRHARLTAHLFSPLALFRYLGGVLTGKAPRYAGVNPGSAYASYVFWLLPFGLSLTGIYMSTNHSLEEGHEVLALLVVVTTVAHLAGILWHSLRHRENVAASMVTGRKVAPEAEGLSSAFPVPALVVLLLAAGAFLAMQSGVDWQRGTFNFLGRTVFQGEAEEGSGETEAGDQQEHHGAAPGANAGQSDGAAPRGDGKGRGHQVDDELDDDD